MYYRFQRRYNLLTVDDTFASLKSMGDDGSLQFEFRYIVSQRDAIKNNASTVKVSILSRTIKKQPLLANSQSGRTDNKQLVSNILTQMSDAKSALKKQENFTVASRNSSILSAINNEIIGQLANGGTKNSIQQLNTTALKLVPASSVKQSNVIQPILTHATPSFVSVATSSIGTDPQQLMHDMINRQGVDPSHVLNLSSRSVSAADSVGGTLRPSQAAENSMTVVTKLADWYVFHPTSPVIPKTSDNIIDSESMHVLENSASELIELSLLLTIPKSARTLAGSDVSHFHVKFDMIDSRSGVTIDTVTKSLDVARHVQLFTTPRIPPIVSAGRSELSSRLNLEIKQQDPGGHAIQVYKKAFWRAVTDVDEYSLVGTYNVKYNQQSLLVQVDKPVSSTVIYRVIALGAQGTLSSEYTNVVVKPSKFHPIKAIALVAQLISSGVQLEIRKIPQGVASVEFVRKNRTTFEPTYTNVGGGRVLIDSASKTADHVLIVDTGVFPGNVYEYAVKMTYDTGDEQTSNAVFVDVINPDPGVVNTVVSDLSVISNTSTPDVAFNIKTTIVDTNNDTIKALLKRQDLYDLFKDDVMKEREFLTSLIAHNVQRIDLLTGQREDFGVVTAEIFSDTALRQNQAITQLQYGHKYRYEIQALLRSPETMFQTLNKTVTDQTTSKTYTYSPAKFFHPVALTQGTLVTHTGLNKLFPKSQMSWGAVGAPTSIEVSFDDPPARIIDAAATQFDDHLNIISWKVQGEAKRIDHFIVLSQVNGVRTLLGKTHTQFSTGNFQLLHALTRTSIGQVSYIVIPIFDDYKVGEQVETNSVMIEEVSP